jgi:MscS family membrane protein
MNWIGSLFMYVLVLEALLLLIFITLCRGLRHLSQSKNLQIAKWVNALWVPLISVLTVSYLGLAIGATPWHAHFTPLMTLSTALGLGERFGMSKALLNTLSGTTETFLAVLYTILFSWLVLCSVKKFESDFNTSELTRTAEYQSAMEALFLFARAFVYIISAFVLMQILDLRHLANSLFATGAVGALFVSFAARDSISNIFGGAMILLDRPFKVGDYISSPDRDIEGTVERIGWRVTVVRTPAKRTKYIPNSLFSTVSIENLTRMSNRRIHFHVGVRYCDLSKIHGICQEIEKQIDEIEFVDKRCSNFCTFRSLGDFSVNMSVNLYTKPQSFREYNKSIETVLHLVVSIVRKHGADFPFPTTTLDADALVAYLKKNQLPKK